MFEVTLFCLTLRKDCKEERKTAWHGSRSSGPRWVISSTLWLVPWLWTRISARENTLVSPEIGILVISVPRRFVKVSIPVLLPEGPSFSSLGCCIFSARCLSQRGLFIYLFFLTICLSKKSCPIFEKVARGITFFS